MAKLTRRGLLKQTAVGVATAGVVGGVVAAAPHLAAMADTPTAQTTKPSTITTKGPMVVLVDNPSTGEGTVMVGTSEYKFQNPDLVRSLLSIAK